MLNRHKATGPDGISNKMLKAVAKEKSVCIYHLIGFLQSEIR